METKCLWHATSVEAAPQCSKLQGEVRAQVAVIGGGITGLSTALHLAEQQVSVVLVEAGDIPTGGSGRNVGLVNAGLWIPPDDIKQVLGVVNGERATRLLSQAPAAVFDLIERHQIECHHTRTGTLHLAHNGKGVEDLKRRCDQWQRLEAPVELLEGEACWQRVGSQQVPAALLDRRAGTLNPAAYTRGLARAAQAAGVQLFTHTPATGLRQQGDGWCVDTTQGQIVADRVVLATNAYTDDHWNQVKDHFFRGHFFQVASNPLPDELLAQILPERQGCWDTRTVLSSLRLDHDGRLILGSLGSGEAKPDAFIRCWADRIAEHYFPSFKHRQWDYCWTGSIGFTPDHMLRLFEPAPGILGVTGYNGRGVTTGTVVGQGFAQYLVSGDDSGLPLPLQSAHEVSLPRLRGLAYDSAFALYHTGQCLRLVA